MFVLNASFNFAAMTNVLISCRTCQKSSGEFLTLDSEVRPRKRFVDLLTSHGLQVFLGDPLPQLICQICVNQLKRMDEWTRKARDTDQRLRRQMVAVKEELLELNIKEVGDNCELAAEVQVPNPTQLKEDSVDGTIVEEEEDAEETQLLYELYSKASTVEGNQLEDHIAAEHEEDDIECQQDSTIDNSDAENASYESESAEEYVEIERLQPLPQEVNQSQRDPLGEKHELICKVCAEVFSNTVELRKHMEILHTKRSQCRNFKCTSCNKRFPTTQKLQQHTLVHTKERNFECPVCGRRFATVYRQRDHLKMHNNERNFSCEQCNKAFTTRAHLKMHLQCHTSERPHVCEVCDKSFQQRSVLRTHMTLHEEKTVECNICNRKFRRTSQLNIHKRLHSGDRPYKCEQCSNTYMQKSHLDRHVGVHLGIRYNCLHCDKVYTKKSTLNTHVQQEHVRNKVYNCNFCCKNFDKQKGYYYHMKKYHSIEN